MDCAPDRASSLNWSSLTANEIVNPSGVSSVSIRGERSVLSSVLELEASRRYDVPLA
jgi:hypothetical protein